MQPLVPTSRNSPSAETQAIHVLRDPLVSPVVPHPGPPSHSAPSIRPQLVTLPRLPAPKLIQETKTFPSGEPGKRRGDPRPAQPARVDTESGWARVPGGACVGQSCPLAAERRPAGPRARAGNSLGARPAPGTHPAACVSRVWAARSRASLPQAAGGRDWVGVEAGPWTAGFGFFPPASGLGAPGAPARGSRGLLSVRTGEVALPWERLSASALCPLPLTMSAPGPGTSFGG
ncbi:PREDICTED: uncharacterized protein LOC105551515 [Mandrillus leucophaeus]|uniref:uncharacterized protein LOC105551515 n=1 Tax=Mandrillus leucophaeus TaxID=9568 RepID=UPI0005F440C3|nr:PREDICTED: uncharacterized protein LOC105551515 [Mandrillus leucophaeus]